GAIFGQTEGLLGDELDLRELQKSGRIGRIEINLQSKQDKTTGTILIPTSLDRVSTAIIAASLESIDRVGPCSSVITLEKVEDLRDAKRRTIIDRAKKILHEWTIETLPTTDEIFREVSKTLRMVKVEKYGPEGLTAGPQVEESKEILIVEGRADVINLLKYGIENAIAVQGAKIPRTIINLCRKKKATAFLDGDRGGDLILKELMQVTNIKYVARAPQGKEVEELNGKQIKTALKNKAPVEKAEVKKFKERRKILVPKQIVGAVGDLEGTLEAVLLNGKMKQIERLPVSGLAEKLNQTDDVDTVVFDGVITQRLVDIASQKKVTYIVAARISDSIKQPLGTRLLTFTDVKK
ncbi:DNA primase, partial [Candidatus Bathyarchaeota archaeon]|nr:DNA primase [Candidatus Bathyarchaeota archaeon]